MSRSNRLLVVDGAGGMTERLSLCFGQAGQVFELVRVKEIDEMEAALKEGGFDLMLVNAEGESDQVLSAFSKARTIIPEIPGILIFSDGDWRFAVRAVKAGAVDVQTLRDGPGLVAVIRFQIDAAEERQERARMQTAQSELAEAAEQGEMVRRMIGGIAHDFNNLLQAMLGLSELVRIEPGVTANCAKRMEELRDCIERGGGLARQLLQFARREPGKPERFDLSQFLRDSASLLRTLIRPRAEFILDTGTGPYMVEADRTQIQQVLVNLAANAADAIGDHGRLTVRSGSQGDDWVWLQVEDTGPGVPTELRDRVFEPFFTTKDPDQRKGLGLPVAEGIIAQHHGRIELLGGPGGGAVFRVLLPRIPGEDQQVAEESRRRRPSTIGGQGERVLIVEDEPAAREGLLRILGRLGYEVTAVESGEGARAIPRDPPFRLLLTDLMLPGVSGITLATELKERWPRLKVIVMSGFEDGLSEPGFEPPPGFGFLPKPVDMATLSAEIQKALGQE